MIASAKAEEHVLFHSSSAQHKLIDMIYRDGNTYHAFQVTVGQNHDAAKAKFDQIQTALCLDRDNQFLHVYYAIPAALMGSFYLDPREPIPLRKFKHPSPEGHVFEDEEFCKTALPDEGAKNNWSRCSVGFIAIPSPDAEDLGSAASPPHKRLKPLQLHEALNEVQPKLTLALIAVLHPHNHHPNPHRHRYHCRKP